MVGYHPSKYYNGKYYRKLDWDGVIHFAMEGKQAHLYFWQSESGLGYWNLDDRNQIYFDGISDFSDFNKGGTIYAEHEMFQIDGTVSIWYQDQKIKVAMKYFSCGNFTEE